MVPLENLGHKEYHVPFSRDQHQRLIVPSVVVDCFELGLRVLCIYHSDLSERIESGLFKLFPEFESHSGWCLDFDSRLLECHPLHDRDWDAS